MQRKFRIRFGFSWYDNRKAKIQNRNVIQNDNNHGKINKRILKPESKKKLEFKSKVVASKRRERADGGRQTTLDARVLKKEK